MEARSGRWAVLGLPFFPPREPVKQRDDAGKQEDAPKEDQHICHRFIPASTTAKLTKPSQIPIPATANQNENG